MINLKNMPLKFVNIGDNPLPNPDPHRWVGRRQWDACIEYNFISAGQHPKYSSQLFRLNENDVFAAYSTGRGYLGIGKVVNTPVEIKKFSFNGLFFHDFNIDPRIVSGQLVTNDNVSEDHSIRKTLFGNATNKNCEFAVEVEWLRKVYYNDAKWRKGLFAKQHIVCKLDKQIETIKFLSKEFEINLI